MHLALFSSFDLEHHVTTACHFLLSLGESCEFKVSLAYPIVCVCVLKRSTVDGRFAFPDDSLLIFSPQDHSFLKILQLAFQSLGIVYGDLGTSPLYVFYNTFPDGVENTEDLIGALSLIIYSLTLIPLIKYVFIVCKANDDGQGNLILTVSYLYSRTFLLSRL